MTFSIGVVGAGKVASEVHIPSLLTVPFARLAWVTDRDAEKSRRVAGAFGVPHARMPTDPVELPPADIMLLAVPYGVRRPFFAAAAARQNALYVEKPFARSVTEHDGLQQAFAPHRVAVGFQRRCLGSARALRELLRAETLGTLQRMRVEFGKPGIVVGGRYSDDLQMAGGGVLFEVGLHALDFALHAVDATSVEVVRGSMSRELGFDVHTEATARVIRNSLPAVTLEVLVTSLVHTDMNATFETDRATIRTNVFGDNVLLMRPRGSSLDIALRGDAIEVPQTAAQTFHAHWTMFFEALKSGQPNAACAAECRVTTQLIEQLYALDEPSR